jgi:hypothetical protein
MARLIAAMLEAVLRRVCQGGRVQLWFYDAGVDVKRLCGIE